MYVEHEPHRTVDVLRTSYCLDDDGIARMRAVSRRPCSAVDLDVADLWQRYADRLDDVPEGRRPVVPDLDLTASVLCRQKQPQCRSNVDSERRHGCSVS